MVGALIEKNGKIIAEGFHARFGGPHAEVVALKKAGVRARGATLHTSLEPCTHKGKTPPCTDSLIAAGVKRVVYYSKDPNPKVRGRAERILRRAGIACEFLPGDVFDILNFGYFNWIQHGRPFVTLKACCSLDGRIADYKGRSRGLGDRLQQHAAHTARSEHDAMLIGAGTLLKDNPRLTVRTAGRQPRIRILLDRKLATPPRAKIFSTLAAGKILIICDPIQIGTKKAAALKAAGAELLPVRDDGAGFILRLLKTLGRASITSLLVEGGATVLGRFLQGGHADLILLYYMPVFLGEQGIPLARLGKVPLGKSWPWNYPWAGRDGYLELVRPESPLYRYSEHYPAPMLRNVQGK
jgi:diaminohydroxyphosphoribosylaminopyrimidine deaminase/5-amino-6-(5-phosphoribosylamino)uracil reductase